jgi:hypothetical protein
MYGITCFFLISLWFFVIGDSSITDSLYKGCFYSFWVFLITALFYSYKMITEQCIKIILYRKTKHDKIKWTKYDTYDTLGIFSYVLLYWIQVCFVTWPLLSKNEDFIISIGFFIISSFIIIIIQSRALINGIMNFIEGNIGE